MFSRAQAGLEYLMTYGWALVLIVTVAGVLFFVMAPPTGSFVCTSSQPEKIIMKHYNFPYSSDYVASDLSCQIGGGDRVCTVWGSKVWGPPNGNDSPGDMVLQNGTGGDILITGVSPESTEVIQVNGAETCDYQKNFTPSFVNGVDCLLDNVYDYICPNIAPSNSITVQGGGEIRLEPALVIEWESGDTSLPACICCLENVTIPSTHSFSLNYTDQFGYDKDVTITCQGVPPTS